MKVIVDQCSRRELLGHISFLQLQLARSLEKNKRISAEVHSLKEDNLVLRNSIVHLRHVIDDIAVAHERASDVIYAYERGRFLNEKHEE